MSFKSILAPLTGAPSDAAVLATAGALATALGAHVTALFASADPSTIPMAMLTDGTGLAMSEGLIETVQKQIAQRRARAQAHFTDWCKSAGLRATKRGKGAALKLETGEAAEFVRIHGVVSDLVILPLPSEDEVPDQLVIEAALFDAGRPVLAVPGSKAHAAILGAPVLVAWNGSAEAAHAVTAALPFLAAAETVTLLHAGEADESAMLNPLAAYLARHRVTTAIRRIPDQGNAGQAILDEAERLGAGLLVIGAYTHSRVREFIFGGVTSHVLRHASLPVLTAH
jgi:nucleotide-binding universal stress UspA family protein